MKTVINWFKSWKLLSVRTLVVAVILIYTIVGFFLVPVIAKKMIVNIALERTGREMTVEKVLCNPFALSLTIRGVSFPDRLGSTMLSFDEFYANAQISSIFRWAATLKELRIENPYLGLKRFADGSVNVLGLIEDIQERAPDKPEEKDEGGMPRALLQHILVVNASLDLEDRAIPEPLLMKLGPSRLELHDISTIPNRQGVNKFIIGLQHGGEIRVTGDVVVEPLGLDGTVTADNVLLEHIWPAIKHKFKFDIQRGNAAGKLRYSVQFLDDGLHATIDNLDHRVEDVVVRLRDSDIDVLNVPSVTITGGSFVWPEAKVRATSVVVERADTFLWIEPDGTPGWDVLVPRETQKQVVETYRKVEKALPWEITVDSFEVRSASARLEDRTFDDPVELWMEDASLVVTDLMTEPGRQWGLKASTLLFGEALASVNGSIGIGPFQIETDVKITDFDLAHFQPYIKKTAPVKLLAGKVDSSGKARVSTDGNDPVIDFAGDLTVREIDLRETVVGSRVLRWGRVDVKGIKAAIRPMSLKVETIDIHGAGIDVLVSEEGKVNLIEVMAVMSEKSEGKPEGNEKTELPPIEVLSLKLHECSGAYTDGTLTPPFTLALESLNGEIRGVSSTGASSASIEIKGSVQTGGALNLKGNMDSFDPKRLTDLSINVSQIIMPPVTPMSIRYIGHPIDKGKVDIKLDYKITNSDLTGSNRFVTNGFTLGDKVEGEGMVNLPFKLGVSMLTDKNGLITIEFPIEGNLDNPDFGLGNAIGSAATEIVSEIIKSPFRMLGKLGGGSGNEDLSFVEFEAGSSDLRASASDRLSTLAAGAEQRPSLIIEVEGAWNEEVDSTALKEASFNSVVAENLASDSDQNDEASASLELLESLYREILSSDELDALRSLHTRTVTKDEEGKEGEPVLNETSYYHDLKTALVAAQSIDQDAVEALGAARAESVRSYMVDAAGVAPGRIRIVEPVAVDKGEGDRVRCRLDVSTDG